MLNQVIQEIIRNQKEKCNHCEGKGYIEIRDCTGEVQREETCVFCSGTGEIEDNRE